MIQITNTQSSHKQTKKNPKIQNSNEIACVRITALLTSTNNNTSHTENGTSGEMLLEKILEEDSNYCDDRQHREFISHEHDEHDKKHLLGNGHTVTVHVTRI